jgi:hypothetical protein
MEWFRWYGGTFNDPKLQWVASKACQPVASVLAVWVAVLERAHNNEVRGCCTGLDFESLDIALGMDDGATSDIYQAMVRKAMIVGDGMVANWEKRQPKTEDIGAAERKRNQREREKLNKEIEYLREQLSVTQSQNVTAVTVCHGMSHDVTTEERRREERREEDKTLKPKTSSTTFLKEDVTEAPALEVTEPSSSRMGLPEFRDAFYKTTGDLLPGGLNGSALLLCQHHPRDKLQQFFWIMASQGGKTFKYFNEIVTGKPKAVVDKKTKGETRQDAALLAAQETLRRVREAQSGQKRTADSGVDGVDVCHGGRAFDGGTAVVVPPVPG